MSAQPPALETTGLHGHLVGSGRCNLTNGQLVIWTGQQLVPHLACYTYAVAFTIDGPVDSDHFAAAFQALLDRSDALRTVIDEDGGVPVQRVLPALTFAVPRVDLTDRADPVSAFDEWAAEQLRDPLPMRERLFDTALVDIGPARTIWFLSAHHVAFDAWSCQLIYQHVADLYARSLAGTLDGAPDLPAFADYVELERATRLSPACAEADAHWRSVLDTPYEPTEFYGVGPASRTHTERTVSMDLGAERSDGLRARTRAPGFRSLNPGMSLLGIFSTLLLAYLHRVGGSRDVSIGLPFQNRDAPTRDTVGMVQQVYPLRVEIDAGETFTSLMAKAMRGILEILAHAPQGSGNPTHQAVNDVMLNYVTLTFPDFAGMPASTEIVPKTAADGSHSLLVQVSDLDASGSLRVELGFNAGVFSDRQQRAAVHHFVNIVDAFLADPALDIDAVDLLAPGEREHVVDEVNATDRAWPSDQTIDRLVGAQAARTPQDVAVVWGAAALTYEQLDARANQFAHHLQSLGAGPGVVVGVYAERCLDLVVAVLAIFKAGAAYLPLDTTYPLDRIDFILRDSRAPLLITQKDMTRGDAWATGTAVFLDDLDATLDGLPVTPTPNAASAEDLAYVIYTSGSTGNPKGAAVPQRALVNVIWWQMHEASELERPRALQFSPLSFDVSLQELFATWCSGGTLVLPTEDVRRNPEALLRLLVDARIEQLYTIFTPLHQLAEICERLGVVPEDLREVFTAGEQVTITPIVERFFTALPRCRFQNQYGSSEDLIVSSYALTGAPTTWPRLPPIGRPIANARIYLLDARLEPVPVGVPGEICIGGAQVALGYLHQPELTAERFVPCPYGEPGATMFRQGDLARLLPDGNLQFLGRMDSQIKLRGFRIEPGEVEAALCAHDLVDEAAVVAVGESRHKRLVAYIVTAAGWSPSMIPELRQSLLDRLPAYMVPATIVPLDRLPRTASGKLDRRALPRPDQARPEVESAYVAPRSELERGIAAVWQETLGIDRVGLHDNFFDLGGHSLLLVQVHLRLRDSYDPDLEITDLFRLPTVSALAALLAGEDKDKRLDEAAERAARQRDAVGAGANRMRDARARRG